MAFLWSLDVPSYLDMSLAYSSVETDLRMNGWAMHHTSIADRKLRAMPRAMNDAVLAFALRQWTAQMSARVRPLDPDLRRP